MSLTLTQLAFDNFQYADISPLPSPPWQAGGSFTLQVVSELCEGDAVSGTGCENYTGITLPDDQYCSATLPFVADAWNESTLLLACRASGTGVEGFESFSDGYVLFMNAGVQLELFVATDG